MREDLPGGDSGASSGPIENLREEAESGLEISSEAAARVTPDPETSAEPAAPDTPDPEIPPEAAAPAVADTSPSSAASASSAAPRPIAPKEYYSISEVCDLVGLKPHVLRYWESQFPVLNPSKNRSGNRVYQRKEIKLILLVQNLLYKDKYTIEGARQRLDQLRRGGEMAPATSHALDAQMRSLLRDELQQLLEVLSPRRTAE